MGNPKTEKAKRRKRKIRLSVYLRDGGKCLNCGAESDLTLDHLEPLSVGGSSTVSNLITVCADCNSGRGNLPWWEFYPNHVCNHIFRVRASPLPEHIIQTRLRTKDPLKGFKTKTPEGRKKANDLT
jgi:hypothetical protein